MQVVPRSHDEEVVLVVRQTDQVMRWGMLGMVAALRRRPSEAFDDIARGKTKPWALLVRRCVEACLAGASREDAERILAAWQQALDLIWRTFGYAPRIRLKLLKSPKPATQLARVA